MHKHDYKHMQVFYLEKTPSSVVFPTFQWGTLDLIWKSEVILSQSPKLFLLLQICLCVLSNLHLQIDSTAWVCFVLMQSFCYKQAINFSICFHMPVCVCVCVCELVKLRRTLPFICFRTQNKLSVVQSRACSQSASFTRQGLLFFRPSLHSRRMLSVSSFCYWPLLTHTHIHADTHGTETNTHHSCGKEWARSGLGYSPA